MCTSGQPSYVSALESSGEGCGNENMSLNTEDDCANMPEYTLKKIPSVSSTTLPSSNQRYSSCFKTVDVDSPEDCIFKRERSRACPAECSSDEVEGKRGSMRLILVAVRCWRSSRDHLRSGYCQGSILAINRLAHTVKLRRQRNEHKTSSEGDETVAVMTLSAYLMRLDGHARRRDECSCAISRSNCVHTF